MPDHFPSTLSQKTRACKNCSQLKPLSHFKANGCENCPMLGGHDDFLSPKFKGMIGLVNPEVSWVAKWQRISECKKGLYAMTVEGTLSDENIFEIEKTENINDAIKRESLFKKVAMKALGDLDYKRVPQDFTGEKLRTRRELDDLEKAFVDKDAEKKRKHEKRLEKKLKGEIEEEEEIFTEELTSKERRLKNKKTYHQTKGQRKKKLKSRKKANRRKGR